MNRYSKYALQSALDLTDGFCRYLIQDRCWGPQEILDVQAVVYDFQSEAEQMLWDCLAYGDPALIGRLRYFLAEDCRVHLVYRMDDHRVVRETARQLAHHGYQVVLEPGLGWAVQVDAATTVPVVPVAVEPEPEVDSALADLKVVLDELVGEQRKKYAQYEAKLATLSDADKAALYGQKAGTGIWGATIGGAVGLVKALPGFAAGYVKTLCKIAMLPSELVAATARSLATGDMAPLKAEADKFVQPLAKTYDQAAYYKSVLVTLYEDEQTMGLLNDFANDYWDATHPLERTEMGASAAADIVVTILLALVTAGVGAAASIADKSARLAKAVKLLDKIAGMLKRTGHRQRIPKKELNTSSKVTNKNKAPSKTAKAGIPEPETPKAKAGESVEKAQNKVDDANGEIDSPKKEANRSAPTKYENRIDAKHRRADEVNAEFGPGWKPPYQKGTRVTEYTTKEPDQFVRVHSGEDAGGQWMMREEAIKGLSPEEIAIKYSLPDVPKYISDVNVPAATRIRTGKVAANFGGSQGATQYQLLGRIPNSCFSNTRTLR